MNFKLKLSLNIRKIAFITKKNMTIIINIYASDDGEIINLSIFKKY